MLRRLNRILAVCSDFRRCDDVIAKSAEIAGAHEAGLTVMFVKEEALFELPVFDTDEASDLERIRHKLQQKVKETDIENVAVFVYENDVVDRAALEAEREGDCLIVTHTAPKINAKLAQKRVAPVLVLQNQPESYTKAVVAVDTAPSERCVRYLKDLFPGLDMTLYQDFQYIPVTAAVDPTFEPYDIGMDATVYTELLEARREAFETFCKEKGYACKFEIGENGVATDAVRFAETKEADLLVVAPADPDTILGGSVEDILSEASSDVLVCFER